MTPDLQSLADEFLTSQEFLLLDEMFRQHGPSLLHAFVAACAPGGLTIVTLEQTLKERMAPLDLPLSMKLLVPDILRTFFSWCATSGAWPPAREWEAWVDLIAPAYLQSFRADGSVKGETFKKQYTDVGRNDPCPCGSGKKFKKCCMKILR